FATGAATQRPPTRRAKCRSAFGGRTKRHCSRSRESKEARPRKAFGTIALTGISGLLRYVRTDVGEGPMKLLIWISAAAFLAACNQSADAGNATANANANSVAAAKPKHPTYCFYKDANTKGWAAATDKSGNVTIKGKAYLEDSGYRGDLSQPEVQGDKA